MERKVPLRVSKKSLGKAITARGIYVRHRFRGTEVRNATEGVPES